CLHGQTPALGQPFEKLLGVHVRSPESPAHKPCRRTRRGQANAPAHPSFLPTQNIEGAVARPLDTDRDVPTAQCASGSGRSWKCTPRGMLPLPPSMSHGVRSPLVVHNPLPFHPALGSSMRPSRPLA